MCENRQRPRSSFDYGYKPHGSPSANSLDKRSENPFHKRSFSERKRPSATRDDLQATLAKKRRIYPHPQFDGFQLVGDSLLLRFSEQVLFERCIYEDGLRYLGLCVSGQTIEELTERVENQFSPIGEKILLLIGTNNMLQHADVRQMTISLMKLLDILDKKAKKVVLLTLPPIPKLENEEKFWYNLNYYNSFLKLLGTKRKNLYVEDITKIFLNEDMTCKMDYFERWYDKMQRRPDLIHLNRTGLLKIKTHLLKNEVLESSKEESDSDTDTDSESE